MGGAEDREEETTRGGGGSSEEGAARGGGSRSSKDLDTDPVELAGSTGRASNSNESCIEGGTRVEEAAGFAPPSSVSPPTPLLLLVRR